MKRDSRAVLQTLPWSAADLNTQRKKKKRSALSYITNDPSAEPSEPKCSQNEKSTHGSNKMLKKTNKMHLSKRSCLLKSQRRDCTCPSCKFLAKQSHKASFNDLYEIGSILGRGGFGTVYAGTHKKNEMQVAIKHIPKENDEKLIIPGYGYLPVEAGLMLMVNSDSPCLNILQLLDFFDMPDYYVLILEKPEPCLDLTNFCGEYGGCLPEILARTVIVQLINALLHCEKCKIMHGDVKPENILIRTDDCQVKLLDFGSGDFIKHVPYKHYRGTEIYAPPEWFLHGEYLAEPATVWSVGVVLYEIVCGVLPFKGINEIVSSSLHFNKELSTDCFQLICWSLSSIPEDRPSLKDMLLHCWFQKPLSNEDSEIYI